MRSLLLISLFILWSGGANVCRAEDDTPAEPSVEQSAEKAMEEAPTADSAQPASPDNGDKAADLPSGDTSGNVKPPEEEKPSGNKRKRRFDREDGFDQRTRLDKERDKELIVHDPSDGRFNFSLGVEFMLASGGNLTSPFVELLVSPSRHFALGLAASFYSPNLGGGNTTGGANIVGLEAGFHYYSFEPYAGFWLHGGVVEYFVSGAGNTNITGALGTVGWRWHASAVDGSLGLGVGPQVNFSSGTTSAGALIRIDLGIDFLLGSIFY